MTGGNWWEVLATKARKHYSQTGEEGILEAIFAAVGTTDRYLVDIGAGNGVALSNTQELLEAGWHGARFDVCYAGDIHQERMTAENVCDVLAKYNVPGEFDLLSLDIDGNDWYILRSLLRIYSPRVFVCEINNTYPAEPPMAIVYDPAIGPQESDYFGATLGAYRRLAEFRGYALVHCLPWNAFFVRRELLPSGAHPRVQWDPHPGWPPDPEGRPWHPITDADVTS